MTAKTVDAEVSRLVREEIDREELARVERIKRQVLERKAAEAAEGERQARIAQVRSDIATQLDPAPLDAAEAELAEALDRYMAVCVAHDRRFSPLWVEISNLAGSGALPADMAAEHRYGGVIVMEGKDWRKSRIHTRLIRAAQAAMNKHRPLDHVDLSRNPQD